MPEFCRVEREGPVTIVTIERPEVMNALHPPANLELEAVFDAFCDDPDQWVAQNELVDGSWWPAWDAWLDARSSGSRKPPAMGKAKAGFKALRDAPGLYVYG